MQKTRMGRALTLAGAFLAAGISAAHAQEPPKGSFNVALLVIFGFLAFFLVPVGAWFVFTGRKALATSRASQSWPTVPATILESRVNQTTRLASLFSSKREWKSEEQEFVFTPIVRYAYEVGGQSHESDVIQHGMNLKDRKSSEAMVARYPAGSTVDARYDPADPARAVLDPSPGQAKGRLWAGGIVIAVPFLITLAIWAFAPR